jgi:hypothetical protein
LNAAGHACCFHPRCHIHRIAPDIIEELLHSYAECDDRTTGYADESSRRWVSSCPVWWRASSIGLGLSSFRSPYPSSGSRPAPVYCHGPRISRFSCGIALVFSGAAVLAADNVSQGQMCLAGGVMNTAMEVGPTVGFALLMAVAATGADTTDSYARAFATAAGAHGVAAMAALLVAIWRHRHGNAPQHWGRTPSPATSYRRKTMSVVLTFALTALLIGGGATLLMDMWAAVQKHLFGVPPLNYALLGRWMGHLRLGRFTHDNITAARPIRGEAALGWFAHYAAGVVFAAVLLAVWGIEWAHDPTPGPALLVGVATIAAPFLLLQPGMGAGIAARRTPRPNVSRLRSLIAHISFGIGLYASALISASVLPG